MTDAETLRRLALKLPEVVEATQGERLVFEVAGKGICWSYLARSAPKARRTPQPGKVAIRCPIERKEMLIEAAPDRFFDDDHYHGYPALLVRLEVIGEDELAHLLYEAWRIQAPKGIQKRHTL